LYIIEGNIGAGKTTFLKMIDKFLPYVKIVDEPLNSWNNKSHGASLLSNFYSDTERWAFTMEMFTLMRRVQEHIREQIKCDQYVVMERSIYSGYYCFALNSYEQGFMNDLEWEIHKQWFNYLVNEKCAHPKGFIYLKTTPKIAYERTKKRNREGEEIIPLSYFQQIDKQLEQFLVKKQGLTEGLEATPVLILDCDQEFEASETRKKQLIDQLEQFFAQTKKFIPPEKEINERNQTHIL